MWYTDGTIECFTGNHLVLAIFAILMLTLCVILIIIVTVIATGKLKVSNTMCARIYSVKHER